MRSIRLWPNTTWLLSKRFIQRNCSSSATAIITLNLIYMKTNFTYFLLVLCCWALPLRAQQALSGHVTDPQGHGLPGAVLRYGSRNLVSVSGTDGGFMLRTAGPGSLQVTMTGYRDTLIALN